MPLHSRLLKLLGILTMPLFLARLTLIPIKSLSICFMVILISITTILKRRRCLTVPKLTLMRLIKIMLVMVSVFFFQAEDGIRDLTVTGVQTCALPISLPASAGARNLLHRLDRNGESDRQGRGTQEVQYGAGRQEPVRGVRGRRSLACARCCALHGLLEQR